MKAKFDSIINSETPTLIDFFAEWCGPCKVQSPILKEMAGELEGKVKGIKIDVDKNSEIASRYQIQSVPTLILFKNGKQVWRQSGLLTKPQLYTVLLQNTLKVLNLRSGFIRVIYTDQMENTEISR